MIVTQYFTRFRYEAITGRNLFHTWLLRTLHGWQVSDTGSCNEYALSVAYEHFKGWLGLIWAVLTGQCVFWWCWTSHWYPSHVVLWVREMGWTDSTHPGWRKNFGGDEQPKKSRRRDTLFYPYEDTTPTRAQVAAAQKRDTLLREGEVFEGTSFDSFQHAFAMQIMAHCLDASYDEARKWCRELVKDCFGGFGSAGYDWSLDAARELADDYVMEFGETHGENQ